MLAYALAHLLAVQSSIYDFTVERADGSQVQLDEYRSPVALVVNTASKCGFTPHYKGLQELYERFGPKGLQVLAFPCGQFFSQEFETNEEIQNFVKTNYGVTFPVFAKVDVNGAGASPLFTFLKEGTNGDAVAPAPWAPKGPGEERDVQWNFSKFLVVKGLPKRRYDFTVEPSVIAADIEAVLADLGGKDEL